MTDEDTPGLETPLFSVAVSDAGGGRAVVAVSGELDITTAPQLVDAVAVLSPPATTAVAIDLSALTFIDSSGINALRTAVRAAGSRGAGAIVASPSPRVLRVLELVRIAEIVPLESSLEAAFERLATDRFDGSTPG
jgi:stage II sporulation protein AA (anti-sigma F factor antagonist)